MLNREGGGVLVKSLGHSPEDLQLLAEAVSTFFGCKKLFLTPADQSLPQHFHALSLETCNLEET